MGGVSSSSFLQEAINMVSARQAKSSFFIIMVFISNVSAIMNKKNGPTNEGEARFITQL
jgi:hypothetical protein